MQDFNIYHAETVNDAVERLKASKGAAKLVAGGTDVLGSLKREIYPFFPAELVSLQNISALRYIRQEEDGLHIGAMSRLSEIGCDPQVKQDYPALAQAAAHTASPQLRNQGTIAGNISQELRCWYLRASQDYFDCLKKGGHFCYAINGDNRYHSIFGGIRIQGQGLPCRTSCPSHVEIPDYIQLIKAGDMDAAARRLLAENPLPAMTGRVCPHFCETKCNRAAVDASVSIREIERQVGDYILEHPELMNCSVPDSGHKVAIIGGGPAGLAAGFYLRRQGHAVTIYEAEPEAGGMLMYAIPGYRLPKDLVRKQIAALTAAGIQLVTDCPIEDLSKLRQEYDAVLCACGVHKERDGGIEGEQYIGSGLQFLREVNTGSRRSPGRTAAVLGGGNTAMDVARTLRRLGAEVTVIYRRTDREMPAIPDDVERAQEEGVQFLYLTQPLAARQEDQLYLRCCKMTLGEADASGRRRPLAVPGSDFELAFDVVYSAFGEVADTDFLPAANKDQKGYFLASAGVYGAGDLVTGASTVTEAMASGKQAARDIHAYLCESGQGCQAGCSCSGCKPLNLCGNTVVSFERQQGAELPVEERNLEVQDEGGFSGQQLEQETQRCLNCGCVGVNPSDVAPALVVLHAQIVTDRRRIPAECFWSSAVPGSTVLAADEVITEIFVPKPAPGSRSAFVKFAERGSIDFPVANCAVSWQDGAARICLNAVAPRPYRAYQSEAVLAGGKLDDTDIAAAGRALAAEALPLSDNAYKVDVAVGLLCQALEACRSTPE